MQPHTFKKHLVSNHLQQPSCRPMQLSIATHDATRAAAACLPGLLQASAGWLSCCLLLPARGTTAGTRAGCVRVCARSLTRHTPPTTPAGCPSAHIICKFSDVINDRPVLYKFAAHGHCTICRARLAHSSKADKPNSFCAPQALYSRPNSALGTVAIGIST